MESKALEPTKKAKKTENKSPIIAARSFKDLEDKRILHNDIPKSLEEDRLGSKTTALKKLANDNNAISCHPSIRFYHEACKRMGVLPLRKVVSQLGRSHVSLRNLTLTRKDLHALCWSVHKELSTFSLDLTGNFIGVKELGYLLRLLTHLPNVFQVSLRNNCLFGQALRNLSDFLQFNGCITRLDLSGNKMTDQDAPAIVAILKNNFTLKTLVLNSNQFREEGGRLIGHALGENNTVENLDVSWNHLRMRGAIGIAKGLKANTALRVINLAWNGFGFEGSVAIGDMLTTNYAITELDLTSNRINPLALIELLRGLAVNKTLRILKIGQNPITSGFAWMVLAVLQKHKETGLENIDMTGVVVDEEFVARLQEIQRERFLIVTYEMSLPVKKMSREEMRQTIGLPNTYNVDPLRLLYLLKEKMRASDFFYKINKNHDVGLQRGELYSLFDEAGIPVTGSVVDKIMDFMDSNGDDTIDLSEFLLGDKRMKNISRKQIIDEQQQREKNALYTKYSRTFQSAHIDPLTNTLKVDVNSTPIRQDRKLSKTNSDTADSLQLQL